MDIPCSTPKRKLDQESVESVVHKKPHSDLEFSSSQVSAESTLINETNLVNAIVEEQDSFGNGTLNDTDQILVETIVSVMN